MSETLSLVLTLVMLGAPLVACAGDERGTRSLKRGEARLEQRAPPAAAHPVDIEHIWLALGADEDVPSDRELHIALGTEARVVVVVEARDRKTNKKHVFASVPKVKRGKRVIDAEPWPKDAGKLEIALLRLEADPVDEAIYDNTGTMEHAWLPELRKDHPEKWHWCPIDYVETDTGWGSVWEHAVDATATTTTDYGGLGTMRFVAKVTYQGHEHFSLGREHRDAAGLKPGLPTVRVRRDDTAVGYMTELINVPYVYGSSSLGGTHQADRGVGADCADLIVYGWRRFGREIDYTWTQGLKPLTDKRAQVPAEVLGIYHDETGRPLKFGTDVQVGDIVLWRRHVGVIAGEDESGYFTLKTPVLHTVVGTPELETMGEVGFGFSAGDFEVRRPKWAKKKPRPR